MGFYRNAPLHARREDPRNVSQPGRAARLRDPHADSGIHLPLPQDRAARLRDPLPRLRARPVVRGAEEPETLHLVVPQRGPVPRGGDQRDPRRPREGHGAALHAPHREVLRARRDLHDGGRGASQARMDASCSRGAGRDTAAIQHAPGRNMMQRAIAIAATALLFAAPTYAADELPPIESFFKLSQYASMRLSPDGQHIAALSPIKDKQGLVIIDVKNRKATPIAARTDRDIVSVEWISDKRLLYTTGRLGERDVQQRGGGIFAIDLDGAAPRLISEGIDEQKGAGMRATIRPLEIIRTLPGEADDVIAQEIVIGGGAQVSGPLYRLDTRTGRKTDISIGKPDAGPFETWRVDRNGTARAFIVTSQDERTRVYYRTGADAPWEKLGEFKMTSAAAWSPVGRAEDGRTLYVSSRKDGDKSAILRYDPETKTLGDVVAQHPQVDLQNLFGDKEGVRGVRYNADKPGTAWFDSNPASAQTTVDNTLPGYVNVLSWSRDRNLMLIDSHSDMSPGSFYLFDRSTNKIEWLADRRPWIDSKKMSPMQPVRYKARDGLKIPAYLTIPRGSSGKALPMVVMVHGGPWVDGDSWGWNPEVQFLASRGYAVLQPNYRGTTHYGWKHFASSFKQWGLAMQDDVTDGVSWAVAQGVADPNRVCIYGGRYRGSG